MKQILSFDAHSLRNDEHAQFHSDVHKLIILQTAIKLGIVNLLTGYETALSAEEAAMQVELGSAYTKTITESDAYRDQLEHGLELLIESGQYHYNLDVQESARKAKRIWDQYGDLRKLAYNEESSAIANRNKEFKNNYASDIAAIGATEWLNKVDEANSEFINHFGSRANEEATRISGDVRAARNLVDPAYNTIVTHINALTVVNGETNYAEFIDQVNYYIGYYKNAMAARRGRKKPETVTAPAQ